MRWVSVLWVVAACDPTIAGSDDLYSYGADNRVLCGLSIDDKSGLSTGELEDGIARAARDDMTVHLYAHRPGQTVRVDTIETVLAAAAEHELAFHTYRELAEGKGLALSFDDQDLEGWTSLRPLFERYGARVTFFITRYHLFDDTARQQLRDLANDGHDIQYHSTSHLDAKETSRELGLEGYLAEDILPDLELMRADGYAPTAFAYPNGARSVATDGLLLRHFDLLRAMHFHCPN